MRAESRLQGGHRVPSPESRVPRMSDIEVLLQENRKFPPAEAFTREALVRSRALYDEAAAEQEWMRPWDRVLEWDPPFAKWFVGGTLNVAVNCLDRHVRTARRNKAALIWEGEPGDRRTLTYWDLYV